MRLTFLSSETFKSLLPVMAGSIITLSGTFLTLSFAARTQEQNQLRAAYATFLTAADEANEHVVAATREEATRLTAYLRPGRRFRVGPLRSTDSLLIADARHRTRDGVARLRKTAYDLLLLEPSADRRERIRTYISHFLDGKMSVDREASRVRALVETGTYPTANPEAETADPLTTYSQAVVTAHEEQDDEYRKLVSAVLDDDRWH